jgi:anti-sigma B factor antagonist
MDIIESRVGQTSVLALSGPLNSTTAPALSERGIGLCDIGVRTVLIDLDQVPYLSSAGFRAFVAIHKRADQTGIGMALCGLNEMLRDLLEVSGLQDVFETYPDRTAALAAIAQRGGH